MKKTKNKFSIGKMATIGAGVAAVGAGAYYVLGPNGKKNQAKIKKILVKTKDSVLSKIKKLEK